MTIEQFGGCFELHSDEGGSEALLEFPLTSANPPLKTETPTGELGPPSISGVRACIVDGDSRRRADAEALLRHYGVLPSGFPSATGMLDQLAGVPRDEWPDVMIQELAGNMEDACADIGHLRRFETTHDFALAERLPAIAIGSSKANECRMQALLAGFQMYLAQPFAPEDLVAMIAAVIEGTPRYHLRRATHDTAGAPPLVPPETRSE